MTRVDIIAPRSEADRLVRAVHRLGAVHVVPFDPPSQLDAAVFGPDPLAAPDSPYDAARERIAGLAELIDGGERRRPADQQRLAELWPGTDADLLRHVDALEPVRERAAFLTAERVRLAGEVARRDSYRRLVDGLRPVVGRLPAIRGYGATAIVIQASYHPLIGLLREELETLTEGRCEVLAGELAPDRVAAVLLYPARLAAEVASMLGGRALEEVRLPEDLVGVPFDEVGPRLAAEQADLERRAAECRRELAQLGARHGPEVAALALILSDRLAEARALRAAGLSDHLVVLDGWIPTRRLPELRDRLASDIGPQAMVVERATSDVPAADTPVTFENRRLARAFQPLVTFASTPRYGSIDPTPLLAITFPAFVGLMVGDAGYGLVLLALLLLLLWRARSSAVTRFLWPIGLLVAGSTIGFGVLFGEWFGDAGHEIAALRPLWIERREALIPLLVLALSIGIVHVGLGVALGVGNATRVRRRHEAAARAVLLVAFLCALLVVGWSAGLIPAHAGTLALGALIVALVVLLAMLGIAGPLEVIGALGNVLSYARLMAIGLASVMLALVANRLGGLAPNALVGALVAGLLHGLNFSLGFFDASIQGLRLHYVEFFTKFVEPGGVPYEPFVSALGDRNVVLATRSAGGS